MATFNVEHQGKRSKVPFTSLSETVKHARAKIAKVLKVDAAILILLFRGKILADNLTFHDYSFHIDNTLVAVAKRKPSTESDSGAACTPESSVSSSDSAAGRKRKLSNTNRHSSDHAAPIDQSPKPLLEEEPQERDALLNSTTDLATPGAKKIEQADYACDSCASKPEHRRPTKCKECGCRICGVRESVDAQTLSCDECGYWFHWPCVGVTKPVESDDWFCPGCKNVDVVARAAHKRGKAATCTRDWGRGHACRGAVRFDAVPSDHVGKIPGVRCGQSWEFRTGCSSAGVHRPLVAGIAGGSKTGAVSLVISGGYEDDVDDGFEFLYTGSGGRDLKRDGKNLRSAPQTSNQQLTKNNMALAMTCDAAVNEQGGAVARDWRMSRPVRVLRSAKAARHNAAIAPPCGVRYDGLYRLVKYFLQAGESGFLVWRFEFRRDDEEPAPWTPEGLERTARLGLTMVRESPKLSTEAANMAPKSTSASSKGQKASSEPEGGNDIDGGATVCAANNENGAVVDEDDVGRFWIAPPELEEAIKRDSVHAARWNSFLALPTEHSTILLSLMEAFTCPICQELLRNPRSPPCGHSMCEKCFKQYTRQATDKKTCPECRGEISFESVPLNRNFIEAVEIIDPAIGALVRK